MRIVCVTPMYPEAKNPAFGVFVKALNDQLQGLGHTIEVLRRGDGKRGAVSYVRLLAASFRHAAKRPRPDIIHGHYLGPATIIASLLGFITRRPVVLTAHGSDIEAAQHCLVHAAWRVLLGCCSGLHVVSHALAARARELVGALPANLLVQPIGVDTALFAPQQLAAWELPRLRLLMVGRLSPEKGWSDALSALALLRQQGYDAVLTACGDGNRPWFAQQLDDHAVAASVDITGFVPPTALPALYANAHVVLVPSWREGFGLAGLEAMAVGTPVVSTIVGGLADYVRDGVNACVVPAHDPAALAAGVVRISENPALRTLLRQGGIATAERYSVVETARALLHFYEQCASRGHAKAF